MHVDACRAQKSRSPEVEQTRVGGKRKRRRGRRARGEREVRAHRRAGTLIMNARASFSRNGAGEVNADQISGGRVLKKGGGER